MLPINHLKKTLDRCCGQWEFVKVLDDQDCFEVRFLGTSQIYQCYFNQAAKRWFSEAWQSGTWIFDGFLSSRLNGLTRDDDGKPTPLVTTDLLTGKKGLLSFATQELKDDFLRHAAPVMESPDKEVAE